MDGIELSGLMHQRWTTLKALLEISNRQVEAIGAGRMSELMTLLAGKQAPLSVLHQVSEKLRGAADDDPQRRHWSSQKDRETCRQQQEECEKMHLELLAIEAECETALQASRDSIQQRLQRLDAGRQATHGYAESATTASSGGRLDLSSD